MLLGYLLGLSECFVNGCDRVRIELVLALECVASCSPHECLNCRQPILSKTKRACSVRLRLCKAGPPLVLIRLVM